MKERPTSPRRIQRRRTRGWRLPEGAVCVTRPGPWGNPFRPLRPDAEGRRICVETYREALAGVVRGYRSWDCKLGWQLDHLAELRGRDLACWCPLPAKGEPDWCHAAVLIELANALEGGTWRRQQRRRSRANREALPGRQANGCIRSEGSFQRDRKPD